MQRIVVLSFCFCVAPVLAGGIPATEFSNITVTGERPAPTAQSAAEGIVLEDQLQARPVARVAELLEFVPGMIATQHSGEGKANQYFLRGFNLDHGTDFATFVDGMPVNMRSHAHGQGYSDLNFLIPEMVESLSYRKGPYYADVGDFSAAGSARFALRRRPSSNELQLSGGENGYGRVLARGGVSLDASQLVLAAEATRYDGPWLLDQSMESSKWMARYASGDDDDRFDLTLMGYDSRWTATDQIPLRAVQSGDIDRLGFIDPTVGGQSTRYSLSFTRSQQVGERQWQFSGYAIDYALDLFSNFTYFLDDPQNGDQFEQLDERRIYGLSGSQRWPMPWAGPGASLELGGDLRHDAIDDLGLFKTRVRQRLATVRRDQVDETSAGFYAQFALQPAPRWRVVAGLRADYYYFDVNSDLALNSGHTDDAMLSPKLSLAYAASDRLNWFASYGRGFHSNDARGTVIRADPASPAFDPVDTVEPLVAADALDLGMALRLTPALQLSAVVWALALDSELVYVGDGGATEASDASERYGVELSAYITPLSWLVIDVDYAWSHARLDVTGPDDRIPNAVESVASLGLSVPQFGPWSGGLRLRYLGPAPLIEDNSVRSQTTTIVNLEGRYALSPLLDLSAGVFNLFDSTDNDITYFYESRLQGEPADGVADVHFHPVEPRHLRAALSWRF